MDIILTLNLLLNSLSTSNIDIRYLMKWNEMKLSIAIFRMKFWVEQTDVQSTAIFTVYDLRASRNQTFPIQFTFSIKTLECSGRTVSVDAYKHAIRHGVEQHRDLSYRVRCDTKSDVVKPTSDELGRVWGGQKRLAWNSTAVDAFSTRHRHGSEFQCQ